MSAEPIRPLPYAERFAAVAAGLPGQGLPWLAELRADSIARVTALGLPTPRIERWKYTNLNPLLTTDFVPAPDGKRSLGSAAPAGLLPAERTAHRLVFVNGALRRDLSRIGALPAGVALAGFAEALTDDPEGLASLLTPTAGAEDDALIALNTAFMADGCVLRLGRGVALDEPIELLFIGAPNGAAVAFHPRNLIVAEPGSRATVVETHVGAGSGVYWSHPVCGVTIGDGAVLTHLKLLDDGLQAFHIAHTDVRVAARGRYDSFVLTTGGAVSRDEIAVVLDGDGAECRLTGAYLARGRQHVDNTTEIVHAKPRTVSREVYKGVLDDRARGVFQGRIVVAEDAQKSDGHQLNKTLLLSDRAEIDSKPQLEIYADDVKCSHGATAGELEEDALFYLRSRGIAESAARRLLIEAFLGDVLETVADAGARAALARRVGAWLSGPDGGRAP
ncbi:MAG: Fe-S cluster assembly protein SufD [Dongiaceae bacterium]